MNRVFHRTDPLFPRTPITPGRRSDGVWKAATPAPPPGTLPHPLENASRFPQPTGHDGELERKEDALF